MFGRILTIAILSAGLALPAAAQNPKQAGRQQGQQQRQQRQQKQVKRKNGSEVLKFQKSLHLTDEQTNQVRALLAQRDRQMGELKGKDRRSAQEQFRTNLRAILTPEQAQTFDQQMGRKR
jgi:hypothetical protein